MATLVITGAQRPVAANLAVVFSRVFDVVAICDSAHDKPARLAGCQLTDAADSTELADLIHGIGPQAVIHCNPLSEGSWTPADVDPNRDAATICAVAQAACHVQAHFTFVSTDAIFGPSRVFHKECCDSRSASAALVSSVEAAATEWGGLVLRTNALAWGTGRGEPSFADRLERALADRKPLAVSQSRYATPVLVDDLAEGWLRAYDMRLRGTLHIGGAERVSQLRFARSLANELDLSANLKALRSTSAASKNQKSETSLCSRQAQKLLGWQPAFLPDTVREFVQQKDNGRWEALGRSVPTSTTAKAA